jgi:HSP20 family protein
MDDRRKRRREFFGDIFDDFDREFVQMREYMDRMFEQAVRAQKEEGKSSKPFVYGFTIRTGPDGIPHIRQFGNTRRSLVNSKEFEEGFGREPLTDVIEDEKGISITAELPGVEKEDVDLDLQGSEIVIKVDTENRKYHKKIELPEDIDPDSITATYKNGVLDVCMKKRTKEEEASKKINIE